MRELVDQISLAQDEKATKGMEGNPSSGPLPHDSDELEKYKPPELPQLQRRLKSRHLQMIAIGMPFLFVPVFQYGPLSLILSFRWNHRYRSIHW